jgi:hypothetical protein
MPNNIDMIPVESSNISKLGYDNVNKIMHVEFKSGTRYRYFDVTYQIYTRVLNADSVGSTFNLLVKKGGFKYEKPEQETVDA